MVSTVSSELSAEQQASLQIRTGADVISFYRKSDGSSSVHFFQCNRWASTPGEEETNACFPQHSLSTYLAIS